MAAPLTGDRNGAPTPEARRAKDIAAASRAFDNGQISQSHALIAPWLNQPGATADEQKTLGFLQLGCALYRQGDLEAARKLNKELPLGLWPTMRYRLSLRLRDPATAKRLRRHPGISARTLADFRTSAGLHALWAGRYGIGFKLFTARHAAINFPRVLPDGVTYAPLPDDPTQDLDVILLEQGLGEVLFHLAHIRAEGAHARSHFIGQPRYGHLVRRYLPDASFAPFDSPGRSGPAHLAGDFVARHWRRTGKVAPPQMLDQPTRHAFDQPVFGLCWRGGSGQNRREERHVPLAFLLDMLPLGARFLALQHDMTTEERKLLLADPRCAIPLADITRNPVATVDMIRPLAGVISVDSANWHMAGFCGVPLLAVMNRTAHWFWGRDADAASVFPSATTIQKEHLDAEAIAPWIEQTARAWAARPVAPLPARHSQPPRLRAERRPVFICGLPRSGTSVTTRILAAHGLWLGETIPATSENPTGFQENRRLRETLLKPTLTALGADPRGVAPLPRTDSLPPFPDLARRMRGIIRAEGYDGKSPWGYKDPKLALLWPLFARAFPQATWVIVKRDRETVLRSIARASFMRVHSSSTEFWIPFCNAYDSRLRALERSGVTVLTVDGDAVTGGDHSSLAPVCATLGLSFDPERAAKAAALPNPSEGG
ncbi:sulfotransferase [Pseudooceanicola sp. HF7]|uniref:sulfotransferase n=1 Tax=Pseudooceanicola sp. HF7 TaxID=2721560 RepID=UPI001431E82A|nr:sulfotransferase [Pseudooceanicola sp. HF7]NIZ08520.1 sulfotransferase [Pseudooceanicola sp. HF7]